MTLTEFNQNVSRATRIARTEDLIITDRGVEAFQLKALPIGNSKLEQKIRAGLVKPAKTDLEHNVLPRFDIGKDEARALIEDFEKSRGDLYDY